MPNDPARKISLKDLAQAAGLSVSGVSRALRREKGMAPDTCKKVRRIAQDLGYRPNALLASLASRRFKEDPQRRGTPILMLSSTDNSPTWADNTQQSFRVISAAAERLGYIPECQTVHSERELQNALDRAYRRGVQGVVLSAFHTAHLEAGKGWDRFSVISFRANLGPMPFDTVEPDHFGDTRRAWEHLWSRGHRRIGTVLFRHEPNLLDDELRLGAICACNLRHTPRDPIPPYELRHGDMGQDTEFFRWFDAHQPEALVGFHVGTYHYLYTRRPNRLRAENFVCLHVDRQMDAYENISGLLHDLPAVGEAAMQQLDRLIRHGYRGIPQLPSAMRLSMPWRVGAAG